MATGDHEFAALLTLLQQSAGVGRNEIAADVATAGSAAALLEEPVGGTLFAAEDAAGDLTLAETDVRAWREAGFRWVSVLDPEYPSQLLGIREVPPFHFTRATFERRTMACRSSDRGQPPSGG